MAILKIDATYVAYHVIFNTDKYLKKNIIFVFYFIYGDSKILYFYIFFCTLVKFFVFVISVSATFLQYFYRDVITAIFYDRLALSLEELLYGKNYSISITRSVFFSNRFVTYLFIVRYNEFL